MPFTLSHVVAVLPFTGRRLRRWFDPTALVIGSMVPDLPLFWPVLSYSWSHHLPFGPLTYDLVLGVAVYVIWTAGLRRPVTDLAPGLLRERLPAPLGTRAVRWPQVALGAVVAVVVGASAVGGIAAGLSLQLLAYLFVTRAGAVAMLMVVLCCLWWWIHVRLGSRSRSREAAR